MSANICNTCGANLIYKDGKWVCPACGAYKTEEISNEEVTLLYNAAQKLRLASFDDAEEDYRDIIAKYPENSEAHWCLVLSKYGIKYEDDYDGKKLPTCYATSIESILTDKDYLDAVRLCKDKHQKEYYIEQGKILEKIRVEWLEKASKEPKYDVFLCFKDSDKLNNMERTDDSIEVANLYTHLSSLGYKVFYSRESLRDKVAEKYEPYIYNALNTTAVMIVYGSKPEYFSSVWMKNEWTRYVRRLREGLKIEGSLLIACDGVNPADLPKPLNQMQVLDARKKTFYGDLEKQIAKIVSIARRPKATVERVEISSAIGKKKTVINTISVREFGQNDVLVMTSDEGTELSTVNLFLQEGLFDNAKKMVNEILNKKKNNCQALLYGLLIKYKVRNIGELLNGLETVKDFSEFDIIIENADKDIGMQLIVGVADYVRSNIAKMIKGESVAGAINDAFSFVCKYEFDGRDKFIEAIINSLPGIKDLTEGAKLFDRAIMCIDGSDVERHISMRLSFAKKLQSTINFALASKYYKEIIDIEEGNLEALWGIILCNLKASRENDIAQDVEKFNCFKELENLLKYCPDMGIRAEYLDKLVNAVLLKSASLCDEELINKLANVFDGVIKYYPEECNEILAKYLQKFADNCKNSSAFSLAKKYYAMVLAIDNMKHEAYWGLLQAKLNCRNNDDLIKQKKDISEFPEFSSAIATASNDEKRAYVILVKEQKEYPKKLKEEQKKYSEEKLKQKRKMRKARRKTLKHVVSLIGNGIRKVWHVVSLIGNGIMEVWHVVLLLIIYAAIIAGMVLLLYFNVSGAQWIAGICGGILLVVASFVWRGVFADDILYEDVGEIVGLISTNVFSIANFMIHCMFCGDYSVLFICLSVIFLIGSIIWTVVGYEDCVEDWISAIQGLTICATIIFIVVGICYWLNATMASLPWWYVFVVFAGLYVCAIGISLLLLLCGDVDEFAIFDIILVLSIIAPIIIMCVYTGGLTETWWRVLIAIGVALGMGTLLSKFFDVY